MRAQGLPISTIIIAALGIIVLIVLGVIFSGQIEKFGKAASACPGRCFKSDDGKSKLTVGQGLYESYGPGQKSGECSEFSAPYKGSTIPGGLPTLPKDAIASDYRCDVCCIPTG